MYSPIHKFSVSPNTKTIISILQYTKFCICQYINNNLCPQNQINLYSQTQENNLYSPTHKTLPTQVSTRLPRLTVESSLPVLTSSSHFSSHFQLSLLICTPSHPTLHSQNHFATLSICLLFPSQPSTPSSYPLLPSTASNKVSQTPTNLPSSSPLSSHPSPTLQFQFLCYSHPASLP